jgi:molybdopterin synthase sulfur carrier subunit
MVVPKGFSFFSFLGSIEMSVRVKLFASFQEITGIREVELEVNDIRGIMNQIADLFPAMEGEMFTSSAREELRPRVKVMVNGRNIDFLDGIDTKVDAKDRIAVFPPVAGG